MSEKVLAPARTKAMTTAAQLLADGSLTEDQIAAQIGYEPRQIRRWKKRPEFIARIEEIVARRAAVLEAEGIANKQNQLRELQAEYDATTSIKQQRAADPKLRMAPGGDTGLVTRKIKMVPNADPKTAENHPFVPVAEDSVDTGLITARLRILEQAGKVAGWWSEKREHSGPNGGPITFTFDIAGAVKLDDPSR